MATFNSRKAAFARERITITNGAVKALTVATVNDTGRHATGARIVLDSASGDIHFTEEGSTPTTAVDGTGVGSYAGAGDIIVLESYESILKFKAIALGTTNAQGEVVYYR